MTTIFNGKIFAAEKEVVLKEQVVNLKNSGIVPRLISILVGDDEGSKIYLNLKKKAAERVGADLEIINLSSDASIKTVKETIEKYNQDNSVNGIMIQLPLPDNLKVNQYEIINIINPTKDVDGMREDSQFTTPVVKAVMEIINQSPAKSGSHVLVVGAKGFVGRKLMAELQANGFSVQGLDIDSNLDDMQNIKYDILISVTGQANLIKPDMIRSGSILIDVGSPHGDIAKEAYEKASFVSPVPGGVGPVTIACLMENLMLEYGQHIPKE